MQKPPLYLIAAALLVSCDALGSLPIDDLVPLNGFVTSPLIPNSPAVPIVDPEIAAVPIPPVAPLLRLRTLIGTRVVDSVQAPLGTVEDFWIDRATGEIAFLSVLRNHGERVFVPQTCLRWNAGEGLGLLNLRERDIKEHISSGREVDFAELFRDHRPLPVEGRITDLAESEDGFLYVKLREANNHRHRVLISPLAYLEESALGLAEDQLVRFEAVQTRDENGRLWIASTVKRGSVRVRFRDPDGRPLWKTERPEEAELPWGEPDPDLHTSAVALGFGRYEDPDQLWIDGNGLVLDESVSRVEHLVTRIGEEERLLPFAEVDSIGGDSAVLRIRRGRIADAPALRPGDLSSGAFWSEINAYFDLSEAPLATDSDASASPFSGVEEPRP